MHKRLLGSYKSPVFNSYLFFFLGGGIVLFIAVKNGGAEQKMLWGAVMGQVSSSGILPLPFGLMSRSHTGLQLLP